MLLMVSLPSAPLPGIQVAQGKEGPISTEVVLRLNPSWIPDFAELERGSLNVY